MADSKHKARGRELTTGIWGALTTPFTSDNELDEQGLRDLTVYCADLGLTGITFIGVVGEFWTLTTEERKRATEVVVEAADGRIKTCAVTAHHSVEETIELTLHAQESGVDSVGILTPYYGPGGISEAGVYRYFKELCEATDVPICPVDAGINGGIELSPQFTLELAKLPNIAALKVYRGAEHYDALMRAGVHELIPISDPDESQWLELIKKGQPAHFASAAPLAFQVPGAMLMSDYTAAALAGDFAEAERIFERMSPIRDAFTRLALANPGTSTATWLKAWFDYLGVPGGGPVRAPGVNLTDEKRALVHAELDNVKPILGLAQQPVTGAMGA